MWKALTTPCISSTISVFTRVQRVLNITLRDFESATKCACYKSSIIQWIRITYFGTVMINCIPHTFHENTWQKQMNWDGIEKMNSWRNIVIFLHYYLLMLYSSLNLILRPLVISTWWAFPKSCLKACILVSRVERCIGNREAGVNSRPGQDISLYFTKFLY